MSRGWRSQEEEGKAGAGIAAQLRDPERSVRPGRRCGWGVTARRTPACPAAPRERTGRGGPDLLPRAAQSSRGPRVGRQATAPPLSGGRLCGGYAPPRPAASGAPVRGGGAGVSPGSDLIPATGLGGEGATPVPQTLHARPGLRLAPVRAAEVTISRGAFTLETDEGEALATRCAAHAAFLHGHPPFCGRVCRPSVTLLSPTRASPRIRP